MKFKDHKGTEWKTKRDMTNHYNIPYQTFKYNKDGTPDTSKPIKTYYNIPSVFDALRLNFGIGYPF